MLAILAAAFAVILPLFFLGNASGHDFEFHLNSWIEVENQWKLGILYPRWAEWAQYGYGEARFLFYPPASWTLGALLGALLPWKAVSGAYIFIALSLSGCSMFLLARSWLKRNDAIFAAVLYAANPYVLLVVYWRSAYAELLAAALLPLLLLFVMRAEDDGTRASLPLGMIVAAAWLTNVPAAVMVSYSLALLMVVLAILRRSPRIALTGALAVALGFALASFYLIPAIYEQRWVDISQVFSPGVRPQENFLFTNSIDPEHARFNFIVSLVAFAEMITALAGAALSFRKRNLRQSWWLLATWTSVAALLLFSFTSLLWVHFPKLRFVQLPWRWLLCLGVPLSLFVTVAWKRWLPRLIICVVLLTAIVFCWRYLQPPWWDTALDIAELQRYTTEKTGYEGTDEYVPRAADPTEVAHDARWVTLDGPGNAQFRVLRWDPEIKLFTANVSQSTRLALRLFNYPAWQVEVNGHTVAAQTRELTGQILIPVAAGDNRVEVHFIRTWDRTVGGTISILTALGLAMAVWGRGLPRPAGGREAAKDKDEV